MAVGPEISVEVIAETSKAVAEVITAAKAMEAALSNIDASFSDFYNKQKSDREANAAGESVADEYGKGFAKGRQKNDGKETSYFKRKLKLWGGLIAAFGETVGVALYGASGAIVSLGSSLIGAISAGAALVPIIVGLGAAFGAIVLGSQGVGDAFGAINEEFKTATKEGREFNAAAEGIIESLRGLSPNAAAFAQSFAAVRETLGDIQQRVQNKLFDGLATELDEIGKPGGLIARVGSAFEGMATQANLAFKGILDALSQGNVGGLLQGLVPVIGNVLGALAPLTTAFLDFVRTATPFALQLSEQFQAWAKGIADFTSSAEGVTAIEGFLDRAVGSLQAWLDLIGATGKLISTVLKAAQAEGDGLITSLTGVINQFNAWLNTAEGNQALTLFLENSTRLLKALGPILDGLVQAFDNLVTPGAVARFEELGKSLGEILPFVGTLLEILGRTEILNTFAKLLGAVVKALEPAIEPVQKLADAIGKALGKVLDALVESGVLDTLSSGIAMIAEAAADLVTELFSNEEFLTAFSEGLNAIAQVIVALLPSFLKLVGLLPLLLPPITSVLQLLPQLADLLISLTPLIELIIGVVVTLATAWVAINEVIRGVVIGAIELLIGALQGLVDLIFGAVQGAIDGLSSAWEATTQNIRDFWNRNIAPLLSTISGWISSITGLWSGFTSGISSAWEDTTKDVKEFWDRNIATFPSTVKGWIDTIVGFFKGLPGQIATGLSGLWDAITGPFQRAWDTVSNLIGKIVDGAKKLPGGGLVAGALNALPFAKGGLVSSPTLGLVGEAGREAIIPLDKPLSQVDPSVRAMAAMLRGKDGHGRGTRGGDYGARSITNNSFVINEVGDGNATAQRVVNRLAIAI